MPNPLRSFYNSLRANLHGTFNPAADMESPNIHRDAMRGYTNQLSQIMEPEAAGVLMDAPGFLNESVAGILAPTLDKPKPFFSKQGFDFGDINQNWQGQNLAVEDQRQKPAPLSRLIGGMTPLIGGLNSLGKLTRR